MMSTISLVDDLYLYNDWANGHILRMCSGLTDDRLDQPRELGFGTLRATVFHILAAEEIWLERWEGQPWRPFPFEPLGTSIDEIGRRLQVVAQRRRDLIHREQPSGCERQVKYQDSKQNEYVRRLQDLLVHVANHGTYHRAQALSYLKQFGRTLPVGLDYLVYKLAYATVSQEETTVTGMRQFGLEVEIGPGHQVAYNPGEIRDYFAFHDWANQLVMEAAHPLDDAALDRDFGMGLGTIRKTLIHLSDVEAFWFRNWQTELSVAESSPSDIPLTELTHRWSRNAANRNGFIDGLDTAGAERPVKIQFGGPPLAFRVLDSLIQICVHGTHHRAQVVNMLRHSGVQPPTLDYARWISVR